MGGSRVTGGVGLLIRLVSAHGASVGFEVECEGSLSSAMLALGRSDTCRGDIGVLEIETLDAGECDRGIEPESSKEVPARLSMARGSSLINCILP
jgi:hypothetical protein